MSVPQDRNAQQSDLTPDPLPPDVKIIECSCALADSRTEDNSKWINVIKEPIEVAKGSEIRVLSNYIDMRGIDSEIIQFQNTGPTQDNSHTLLTQLYTTNDGYNNKTTSYDYLCYGEGFDVIDCGENYGTPGSNYTTTGYGGSGTGAECFKFVVDNFGLRPKKITITNGGRDYENGAIFRIVGSTAANDYVEGKVITDDIGSIVDVKLTKSTLDTNPSNPNTLVFVGGTLGTGAVFSNTFTSQALASQGVDYTQLDTRRGQGYLRGDVLYIEDLPGGGKNVFDDRGSIEVNQIYTGIGQISNNPFYDQGYNYQQTPVERWSQTYELSSAFCYGANTGTRTFTSHGQQVSIQDEASHQVNDKCLSASNLILNKEDEFAPGIYHTGNNTDQFFLNAPVLFFDILETTGQFEVAFNNGSWVMEMVNGYSNLKINGNSVNSSPFNIMAQGSVWQFQLDFSDPAIASNPTPTQLQELNTIAQNWSVPMRVKELLLNQETFGGGARGTRVVFDNSIVEFKGEVTEWVLGTTKSGTGVYPANSFVQIETDFVQSEDTQSTPTTNPIYEFQTDATGIVINSALLDRGTGIRPGMVFRPKAADYPTALETIYIAQVDFTNGWTFPAPLNQTLQNTTLTTSAGDNLNLFLVPVMSHSNLTTGISDTNKGNRIGYRQKGTTPFILDRFPLTFEDGFLEPTAGFTETNNVKSKLSNGVYKNAGLTNSDDPLFETDQGVLANHDTEINLEIDNNNASFEEYVGLAFGTTGTDVIVPFPDPQDWLYDAAGDDTHYLRIHTANWNTATTNSPLPQFCLFQIESANNTARKTYLQLGGLNKTDATYSYIDIISKDIINNQKVVHYTSANIQVTTGLSRINATTNTGYDNFNGQGITSVTIKWIKDYKNFNTSISCKWNDMTGSIGITGTQNFFNLTDPNYNTMKDQKLYQIDPLIRNSYNKGGFYFFTHLQGILSTQAGTNFDYNLLSIDNPNNDLSGANIPNQFNQGYDFWNFAELPSTHYSWRTNYQAPTNTNYNQSVTDITNLWEYQPLYRQKFFEIDKNFCVASDISGIWTRNAHALTGAIDPTTGNEYVPSTETGILQNEFIMAIYGANNLISPTGTYIKDTTRFPDSGGLEPGHAIGKQYITENTKWLAGSLMAHLPKDVDNRTFYYVFFRTPWTKIRGYDPLKENSSTPGNPDRTPVETVNQQAYLIGNANELGQTSKKALNGDTMLATLNSKPPATPPLADNKGYELGEAGGVSPGESVRFGERSFYPIYYLDREERENYPKAKISQFVGSTNLTLAFASDISTFTFQFLHQPYTSPFVDGVGGTNSIRVFYGNRKSGIFNHESLGGVVVQNYARPDFPKSIFTRTEITNNPTFNPQFIYGIDPLRSVGYVGRQFLNKLGFTDDNIGVIRGQIATNNTQLGYKLTSYSKDITSILDGTGVPTTTINSYNTVFYGTTGSDIDASDSILSEIPAPETNAGLESHNNLVTPNAGTSNKILQKFGDFIFYPYSLNTNTNSFQDTALVRYDNASSTYGAVGGLLLSNSNRGMGLPNTVGSTFITDGSSIPRTLNPDCELYLAYTVACGSSLKQASLLPQRLSNAYLVILSSLMREANLYMPKAGFVNAMSIVSKTFLQGDFILSNGQLSFYAKEDFILSQIETEIKDTQFTAPSTLGVNSSVIYQITNYNPQPKKQLPTIEQEQEQDYAIMEAMSEHLDYLKGNTQTSGLNELNKDLYSLGLNVLTGGQQNLDIVGAIRNQIRTYDLPSLTPGERQQFFRTPEGQGLIQNATDLQVINSQIGSIAEAQNDIDQVYGGEQRLENITRMAQREIQQREENIRNRIPIEMFAPSAQDVSDFFNDLPQPQQSLIFDEPYTTKGDTKTYPSMMPELLDKVFTSREEKEDTESKLKELNKSISGIRKNVSPTKNPELRSKRDDLMRERDSLIQSLTQDPMTEPSQIGAERETPEQMARRMGRGAVRRAGYTAQDIANMEAYGFKQKFGEAIDRRQRAYTSQVADSPFKPAYQQSESGLGTSIASGEIVDEE